MFSACSDHFVTAPAPWSIARPVPCVSLLCCTIDFWLRGYAFSKSKTPIPAFIRSRELQNQGLTNRSVEDFRKKICSAEYNAFCEGNIFWGKEPPFGNIKILKALVYCTMCITSLYLVCPLKSNEDDFIDLLHNFCCFSF